MKIRDIELTKAEDGVELAGTIDGFRLFFRYSPGVAASKRGDAFLAAALLPAMRANEAIEIDRAFPVSPALLSGIDSLQDVFATWDPAFKRVVVEARAEPDATLNEGVASFFSGGVDGLYTLLKNTDRITHLLFVKGIDMQVDNDPLFAEALVANREFARARGKQIVTIESNLRRFGGPRGVRWWMYNGAGLASLGLGVAFRTTFIAASHTFRELFPWGSHPLADPLWSTEAVKFVHDGAEATRTDKLARIGRDPEALAMLRVCWQDKGYNCGRCEKCVRTMAALRTLGLSANRLPRLESVDAVRELRIWDDSTRTFWDDTLNRARNAGDAELVTAIQGIVRRYDLRQASSRLGDDIFGGRLKSWYRKVRGRVAPG